MHSIGTKMEKEDQGGNWLSWFTWKSGHWNSVCVYACIATRQGTSPRWTWASWVCLRRSVKWQPTYKYSWMIHPSPVCAFSATFDASTDVSLQGIAIHHRFLSAYPCACRVRYCFTSPVCLCVCVTVCLSVWLSVWLMPVLCENEWKYCQTFWHFGRSIVPVFCAQ